MVKITCCCLNVKIHAKFDCVPADKTTFGLTTLLLSENDFFNQDLLEVVPSIEGVQVEHRYLLTKSTFDGWCTNFCSGCQLLTHAEHAESDRILVSPDLLFDELVIERLINSPDYSPLYKMVLKDTHSSKSVSAAASELLSKDIHNTLQQIQNECTTYLQSEETAMEERIRQFIEKERDDFANVQLKARNDKNALIAVTLSHTYKSVSDSLKDAMLESPVGSLNAQATLSPVKVVNLSSPLTIDRQTIGEEDEEDEIPLEMARHPAGKPDLDRGKKRLSGDGSSGHPKQIQNEFASVDDVFQFDPGFQEDPSQPFSESDDDINDTDDDSSTTADEGQAINNPTTPMAVLSTSVPIRVPQRPSCGRQTSRFEYDEEGVNIPTDPASMAASIQALARSIHGDGSEIFGELPRSRARSRVLSSQSGDHH